MANYKKDQRDATEQSAKGLMLALPVLAVAACSSNKSANNDQSGMGAGTGTENGSNLSSEEQARLQMQELQKNNIVYFGFDKYDIGSDFAQMLDAHAAFLRSNHLTKLLLKVTRMNAVRQNTTSLWVSVVLAQ